MISKFRKYIFLQLVVVLLVSLVFRLIAEKRVASLVAIILFLVGACVVIFFESRSRQGRRSLTLMSTVLFLVFFIIPIVVLRVKSWEGVFESETLMSFTGAQLHRASNLAFMAMLACYFIESLQAAKLQASNEKQGCQ